MIHFYLKAFLPSDILLHFLEGSCSTSLIWMSFYWSYSQLLLPGVNYFQIGVLLISKLLCLCSAQQNASLVLFPEGFKAFTDWWLPVSRRSPLSHYSQWVLQMMLSSRVYSPAPLTHPPPLFYCGFLLLNHQPPNTILMPQIRQAVPLWWIFKHDMSLRQSFPKWHFEMSLPSTKGLRITLEVYVVLKHPMQVLSLLFLTIIFRP